MFSAVRLCGLGHVRHPTLLPFVLPEPGAYGLKWEGALSPEDFSVAGGLAFGIVQPRRQPPETPWFCIR